MSPSAEILDEGKDHFLAWLEKYPCQGDHIKQILGGGKSGGEC